MRRFEPGELPRTKLWQEVLHLLSIDGTVPEIAAATVRAARRALDAAGEDPALTEAFAFLVQISAAGADEDFDAALGMLNREGAREPTAVQILGAIPETIRCRREGDDRRTEVGGLAVLAATEVLSEALREHLDDLFAANGAETKRAVADLARSDGARRLVPAFLGTFLYRCLAYFLSRESGNRVGEQRRFACSEELSAFNRDLKTFCVAAAGAAVTNTPGTPTDSWRTVLDHVLATGDPDVR